MPHPARAAVVKTVAALAVVATLLVALGWWATGGRWYEVRTGSMGRTAPVGSLLLDRPTSVGQLEVGDLVTFHQPDSGVVYTHRVAAVGPGGLRTKGDVNPTVDPWTTDDQHLVGKVVAIWPVAGFALRGLPAFLVVLGLVWLGSSLVRASWRSSVRVVGVSLAFAVGCLLLQPWVGLDRIGVAPDGSGGRLSAVSTGILPVKAHVDGEPVSARLRAGEVGTVAVPADGTEYRVDAIPSLTGWWWAVVVGICLAPLLWTLAIGLAPRTEESA